MNSILSCRTYSDTGTIPLPTVIRSLLSAVRSRMFDSWSIIITCFVQLVTIWLAGIAYACLSTCSALFSPVAIPISIEHMVNWSSSWNLKAIEREQWNKLFTYMGWLCHGLCVLCDIFFVEFLVLQCLHEYQWYNACHFEGSIVEIKLISFLLYFIQIFKAWHCSWDSKLLLPYDTLRITSITGVFDNCGSVLSVVLSAGRPKSVTSFLVPCNPLFLAIWIPVVHFFNNFLFHYHWIHSALLYCSNGSKISNLVN